MQNWEEWEQAKADGYEPLGAKYLNFSDGKKSSATKAKGKTADDFSKGELVGYKKAMAKMGVDDEDDYDDYDEDQPTILASIRTRSEERKENKESQFTFFDKTVQAAKAEGALDGGIGGELTVFVPEDSAFRNLTPANRKALEDEDTASTFVKGHVVEGAIEVGHAQGTPEMYASGSVISTAAQAVHPGISINVIPPRVSKKDLPAGMTAEEPIVQLVDSDSGKILHQAKIINATPIPGRGVVYEIDDVLVPRS